VSCELSQLAGYLRHLFLTNFLKQNKTVEKLRAGENLGAIENQWSPKNGSFGIMMSHSKL
jgi:hypothetical protein